MLGTRGQGRPVRDVIRAPRGRARYLANPKVSIVDSAFPMVWPTSHGWSSEQGGVMSYRTITGTTATVSAFVVCAAAVAHAQGSVDPDRLSALQERLEVVSDVLNTLPPSSQNRLSSGAHNLLKLAERWREAEGALSIDPTARAAAVNGLPDQAAAELRQQLSDDEAPTAATFPITRAANDFLFSLMAGFTQS